MIDVCVPELIARQAKLHPDAIAVLAEDRAATYEDVLDHAERVSSFLCNDGLKLEEPVAVLMHRTADLVGTLLGIWYAGGAYVPIDPAEPARRVLEILKQSNCRRVIGDTSLWEPVLEGASEIPLEAKGFQFIESSDFPAPCTTESHNQRAVQGSRLAYLLFTSGSTGMPKAVEVEHRSVVNLLLKARDLLSVTSEDRYLAVATIAFDISIAELFLPLIVGGSLVLRDKRILLDPHRLAGLVRDTGVTIIQTGPSVWSVILGQAPDFPRVRVAVSTGEAISPQMAKTLIRYADETWNLYGPTESTIWATAYRLTNDQDDGTWTEISAPIGRAIEGLKTLVVDAKNQTAPDNEKGELLIGGIGVARGYRNQPELTRQRFVIVDGTRHYRTGDLVVRDESGVLHFLGRQDDQMKIRGIRVEPREVEDAIRLDNRVKETATTWFKTPTGTKAIAAAVVLQPETTCSASDLHYAMEDKLPSALIPARFIFVPWLPIDKNGKVDRNAIRAAASSKSNNNWKKETPKPKFSTPTETVVAILWQRLMRLEDISPSAQFFSIGGDSLAAVTMTLELESALGCEIPMQLVLETPVLAEFAKRIDAIKSQNTGAKIESDHIFPLVESSGGTPLFFCGVNLSVAAHWNVPCPLFAIAFWASNGNLVQMESVEAIAKLFIKGIRKRQPTGPYRLAGFSFGAVLALEIAQQLKERGETVELLFLLDPFKLFNTAVDPNAHKPSRVFFDRIKSFLSRINPFRQKHGIQGWLASLLTPINKIPGGRWLTYRLFHLFSGKRRNLVAEALLPRNRWPDLWFTVRKIMAQYHPKSYTGISLVLFTEEQGGHEAWSSILGQDSEKRFVHAEHMQLFQSPLVDDWMSWLAESLDVNQSESSSGSC